MLIGSIFFIVISHPSEGLPALINLIEIKNWSHPAKSWIKKC